MKMLLLAPQYLGLYKIVENELKAQGHEVSTILTPSIKNNPYYKLQNPIKRKLLLYRWNFFKLGERFWKQKSEDSILNCFYDFLFVIQGLSFDPWLLNHLREFNPNIKSALYIWDTNRMFDFFHNAKYFDKAFSFDYKDTIDQKSSKVGFLPFFWPKEILNSSCQKNEYLISSVGTDHDDRAQIFGKVISQLLEKKCNFYIRLVASPKNDKNRIRKCLGKLGLISTSTFVNPFLSNKYIIHSFISYEDMNQIMANSVAILDTDKEIQFGTTPRLIWALALNKHIYTTNKNIINFPFYDSSYIHIIDRTDPKIDFDLLSKPVNSRESVEYLRIDNWLKNFGIL